MYGTVRLACGAIRAALSPAVLWLVEGAECNEPRALMKEQRTEDWFPEI